MAEQILTYWLVAQLFGLAGLPLARRLLDALPDRGYAFAKPLGLLLAGYLAWLLAMLGVAPFGAPLVVACVVAVLVGGLLASRGRPGGVARSDAALGIVAAPAQRVPRPAVRASLAAWLRRSWPMILGYESIFAAALVFLALLRAREYGFVGPHPWGTERPMDFAFFNAIRVSAQFPPHDPWMAGYSINYYYFGYLLMAAVALVAGAHAAVGYNLSLALTFAMAALGVAGVVYNLIGLAERRGAAEQPTDAPAEGAATDATAAGPAPPPASRRGALAARWLIIALTTAALLLAGNQAGALQVLVGDERIVALDARQLSSAVLQALRGAPTITLPYPARTGDFGEFAELSRTDRIADFNWWWPSRVVWDDFTRRGDPQRNYTITEFPFFSFWLGDMHPHVMALPFGLLAMALALQTLARATPPSFGRGVRGWLDLALAGVVLGSLYVTNSWDLPTYLLLFLTALLLVSRRAQPHAAGTAVGRLAPWLRGFLLNAALLLLACVILFAPFLLTFRSLVGGRDPLVDLPLLATITRTLGFVFWDKTGLHSFAILFGLFFLPLAVFVVRLGRGATPRGWVRMLLWAALAAVPLGLLIGFPLLLLLPLGAAALLLAWQHAEQPATAFTLVVVALGCAIVFGCELVYIRDVFEARMNTIFKFYYQVWLLWGCAAGFALWQLLADAPAPGAAARRRRGLVARAALAGLCALLLAGGLVYPWLTAGRAFAEGRLVGLAGRTPREQTPEGAASIEWLRQNVPGDAVILEAVGGSYDVGGQGFGGVSSSTGLATVMGWEGHQQQWRGGDPALLAEIAPRAADVATIYSTTDPALARDLLRRYGVDYIYVGRAERESYPPEGLTKLGELGEVVFEQGEVVIYRVS